MLVLLGAGGREWEGESRFAYLEMLFTERRGFSQLRFETKKGKLVMVD